MQEPERRRGPEVRIVNRILEARWGGALAMRRLAIGEPIPFAHLGCRTAARTLASMAKDKTEAKIKAAVAAAIAEGASRDDAADLARETVARVVPPAELLAALEQRYGGAPKSPEKAAESVARTVAAAVEGTGLGGTTFIDTMRWGSDYWRPGSLLGEVAESLGKRGLEVAYAREDSLCPSGAILDRFSNERMGFGEYAAEYERELLANDQAGLRAAAFLVTASLARRLLPILYCSDPYVPGYGSWVGKRDAPFRQRPYPGDPDDFYRELGCHRVVLAERLAWFFVSLGATAVVHELDVNSCASHRVAVPPSGDR